MHTAVRFAALVAAVGGALSLWTGVAEAKSYAAMGEQPVTGGELRLATPKTLDGQGMELSAFPLKHTRVDIDVQGAVASATVEQVFENPFDEALEAIYVFPLGDDAAVHDYEIVIGDRTIKGRIDTKAQARATYEQARNDGRTAGLLEEQKANVFQQSVANIPPHQSVVVRFRYVELLRHKDGMFELVYPMVVGPRYLPANTTDVVSIPYVPASLRPGNDIEVRVKIDASVPLAALTSPSHQIETRALDETTSEVVLAQNDRIPNKDFVLRFTGAGEATQVGLLTHRMDKNGFFTLMVQPKAQYRENDVTPREVVMVIDRSCSMSGEPLQHARAISRELLAGLTPRDTFNFIAFADGTQAMSDRTVPADANGLAQARRWLDALQAGGGTEMGAGMLRSLARAPGEDRIRMIYVMTDGFVGNDDEIIRLVRNTQKVNRVFPIGIGSAPNRYLLERVGEVGRGFTTYVTRGDDLPKTIEALVTRTTQPYLTDVKIDWGGLPVRNVTPALIPDVYAGLPIVVAGRYEKAATGTVRIEATANGKRVVTQLPVELPTKEDRPGVAHLWARRRIHELELQNDDDSKRKEIETLGLSFSLVTPYTSFVAVDERRVVEGGKKRTVVQPVEVPEGVDYAMAVGDDPMSSHATSSGSSGFQLPRIGGGGDVDPFTLLTIGSFLPLAWKLRKRRQRKSAETCS